MVRSCPNFAVIVLVRDRSHLVLLQSWYPHPSLILIYPPCLKSSSAWNGESDLCLFCFSLSPQPS